MDLGNINQSNSPLDILGVALNGLTLRNKAISGNLANLETENYKRREVDFEETLTAINEKKYSSREFSLNSTHEKHFSEATIINSSSSAIEIKIDPNSYMTNGNSVDVDREMLDLTQTGLRFKALAEITKKHLDNMKGIIRS